MAINFNVAPYFDDYDDTKKFLRVLFRPGYAVQARELTQLQTILQDQVSRFGDHIFKNGSMVVPGSVNVDNQVHFAKLEDLYNSESVKSYLTQFRSKIITGVTSGVKALVVDTSECGCMVPGDSDIATLYFKIESTAEDGVTKRFIPGETLTALASDNTTTNNYRLTTNQVGDISVQIKTFGDTGNVGTSYTNSESSDVLGYGYGVEVKQGIYFIDGFFVQNEELHLYIGRFTNTPTARVGFEVLEQIVTPEDDTSLNDNAQGSNNYAAPGAHRYKIDLALKRLALNTTDSVKFVELLRVQDGRVQHKVEKTSYAELEKTFARRTYDESGNYEVNKFRLSVREHLDDGVNNGVYDPRPTTGALTDKIYGNTDQIALVVDPGKAYVQGYEVEGTITQYIAVDKARPINGVENGHIVRLDDQPVGTPVGNYALIDTIRGVPDISTFDIVYLWDGSDPWVTAPTAGTSTNVGKTGLVGTARIRSFQLHSASQTANSHYKMSFFDIQMEEGKTFERDAKWMTDAGLTGTINFYANLAQYGSGGVLVNGTASGTSGSPTITGYGTKFLTDFKIGDAVVLGGNFVGFVISIASQTELTIDSNLTVAQAGTGGAQTLTRGDSRLYDVEYDTLLFKTGYQNTKTLRGKDPLTGQDTVKSSTHTVRRTVTASADAVTSDWSFTLTNVNEFFLSDQDLSNYSLFDNVTKQIVSLTSAMISFDDDANRKTITISGALAGLTTSRSYTLITSILQAGVQAAEKIKTSTAYTATILTKKNVTAKNVILPHADVLQVTEVLMTPGDYAAFNSANSVDITNNFTLDSGQRATHYQAGALVLKEGAPVPTGALQVKYRYFAYSGSGNYFSADSYNTTIDYEDIPSFKVRANDGTIEEVFLHDVIDYRPVISGLNSFTPEIPKIGTDYNTSLAYYLPRFDKVVLDSVGRINVIAGVPALDPKEPEDPKEGMVLATLMLPAYTKSSNDVKVYQRDNRRYTMRDIGKLERRISNLEYYVSLNLLERETEQLSIKDATTGIDRFKNGFIVDQFTGHGIGEVKHPDYKIAVDTAKRELRPMHFTSALEVIEDLESAQQRATRDYQRTGDLITLPYTESLFIFNPNSSRSIDVNPYKIGAFKGEVILSPEGDNWKDTDRRPDLQVQDDNGYDAIRFMAEQLGVTGTQWGEWQNNWTGTSTSTRTYQTGDPNRRRQTVRGYQETITTQTGTASREGIRTSVSGETNAIDYGDRVVDISYLPYMRARPVLFAVKNLKADTRFYAFFDDKRVDAEHIRPADVFKVTQIVGATNINFDPTFVSQTILADDPARTYNGVIEPAFGSGDIIKNTTHTPTVVQTISNITNPLGASSFTMTVGDATGILPGHHVFLYNFDAARPNPSVSSYFTEQNRTQTTLTTIDNTHSKQLNRRYFKVTGVSGTTLTLASIDGSIIDAFDSYATTNYPAGDGGRLLRLQASGVVAFSGVEDSSTVIDIHVVNIKNGFAVGEQLTGEADLGSGARNRVTITSINGGTSTTTAPTMKAIGDPIRTDSWGSAVGVFNLPAETFRTGERSFKLIDNISNSDANFDSKGFATYYSTGMSLQKERTVVNSRDVRFVQDRLYESIPIRRTSTSTRLLYSYWTGHDPVAQTFVVSSLGGAFISSVDLYFQETGNRPVTVELRTTNSGVPTSKIIPFTTVTKDPSQISVSDDGSAATRFTFDSPIYLQDNETYALVVKTDEPGAKVFISELGKTDLQTNNIITSQPLTGSLYLSQNSREFEINPLLDLKFSMNKCVFDTNASANVELKSTVPVVMSLPENPFEFTPNSNYVRVSHPNHGFVSGDLVVISGVNDGYYGANSSTLGASDDLLNGSHLVVATGMTKDSYLIQLQTTDSSGNSLLSGTNANFVKGNYGGATVKATRQLYMDYMFLKSNDLNFQDTSIKWYVNAEDTSGTRTGVLPIVANEDYVFDSRKVIKSFENQRVVTTTPLLKSPSLQLHAIISSDNENVSPVIDMQKLAVYAIQNLVDNKSASDLNVAEIDTVTLIEDGSVVDTDTYVIGSGTITVNTASASVTGSGTAFTTQVKVGETLRIGNDAVGVVDVINSDTDLDLTTNSLVTSSNSAYKIVARGWLEFENVNGAGVIRTWVDAADNILQNAQIGSQLNIAGVWANKINGTYLINNVTESTDASRYAGSADGNKVEITLDSSFYNFPSIAYLNLVNDWIELQLQGSQTSNVASQSISSTNDNTAWIEAGDEIVSSTVYEVVNPDGGSEERLERKVIGTVQSVASGSITLTSNATITITQAMFVRKPNLNWSINELVSFVDDFSPSGATNLANYVTRPLSLATSADSIRVMFDAAIPQNTDIKVYYRVWNGDKNLNQIRWNDAGFTSLTKSAVDFFTEREINVSGITDFTNLQVKFVMKSSNTVYIPKIKNLRVVAHS